MNSEIKNYWEGEAALYTSCIEADFKANKDKIWKEIIHEYTEGQKELEILDVGCGPGFFSMILSEEGHHVIGIDITENMVKEATQNTQKRGLKTEFFVMNSQELTFADESFDVVIARFITWTMADPATAYKEWFRVLKPGGKLIVVDACWYLHLYDKKRMKAYQEHEAHIVKKYGRKIHEHGDTEKADELAKQFFMSDKVRPEWDEQYLSGIGFSNIIIDHEFYKKINSAKEQEINRMSPEFSIIATK